MYTTLNRARSGVSGSVLLLLLVGACGGDGITRIPDPGESQLSIVPANPVLRAGQSVQFTITGPGASGVGSTVWSVGNPGMAKISPDGLLTALIDGEVSVRADLGGKSASTLVTIRERPACPPVTIGFKTC